MTSTRAQAEHDERQWAASLAQPSLCETVSAAYLAALEDPELQEFVSYPLKVTARSWLRSQLTDPIKAGVVWEFVDREVSLAESMAAYDCHLANRATRVIPVSALHNEERHPLWSPVENLLFRFVHDWHHWLTAADDSFEGELAVTRHCLTSQVHTNQPLAHLLASEIVGQAAVRITTGSFPRQIIANNILELI